MNYGESWESSCTYPMFHNVRMIKHFVHTMDESGGIEDGGVPRKQNATKVTAHMNKNAVPVSGTLPRYFVNN